jgi:hypothetical protein
MAERQFAFRDPFVASTSSSALSVLLENSIYGGAPMGDFAGSHQHPPDSRRHRILQPNLSPARKQ